MPDHYSNEFDPFASEWLKQLFPAATVDSRSIVDVQADDVIRFHQAHFFGGIGGWQLALQLAGWPAEWPVWTGSCPCQPFSVAGKQEGQADKRHLWPDMFRLVRECRPPFVFGEQVEAAIRLGWLDGVFSDLEGEGYTCGAAVLGAHSVGAPHIRQRLYWVAHAPSQRRSGGAANAAEPTGWRITEADSTVGGMELPAGVRPRGERPEIGRKTETRRAGPPDFWSEFDLIPCADGKERRIEPGSFPLAHGVPARVGRLRGYGNAIVPQVAAAFIRAFLETLQG